MTIYQLLGSPIPFLDQLFATLEKDGIDLSKLELDHICYRVTDLDSYQEIKNSLSKLGDLLGEHIIGGRPIATFKLETPIQFLGRTIHVLELPAPKAGSPYPEGYEHVEFVVGEPLNRFLQRYPQLSFETKGLDKSVNAALQLQYEDFGVKFHERSLEEVIREEE